jgi:GNAT superfamily N-acetyltransferase
MVDVRKANSADAPGIARVHVDTWRSAYAGLLAAEYLQKLSYERGKGQWDGVLSGPNAAYVYVAEDGPGLIVGFASGGKSREAPEPYTGELHAIYVLPGYQGRGLGQVLFRETARSLAEAGMWSMLTWTLAANRAARAFYESLGGVVVAEKQMTIAGQDHEVAAYGWPDLRSLVAQPQPQPPRD